MRETRANNPVGAVQKASAILEIVKQNGGATIADITEEVDLSKSSIHNYLATLEEEGFVINEQDTFHLGLRCLDLGTVALKRWDIHELAKPELKNLAEETDELANLMVEEHGWGVYLLRQGGEQALSYNEYTGYRSSLYNTAAGKAILAYLPRGRTEQILEFHGMEKTAKNTITSKEELFEELDDIRERGIAFDDEESLNGCRCVAAPLLDNTTDQIRGAISVSGPKSRMKGDQYKKEIPDLIRDNANIIELKISYN